MAPVRIAVDPYKELQVPRSAKLVEIRAAYRRLALVRHPDKGGSTEAIARLNSAYEVLRDPTRRREYDEFGALDTSKAGVRNARRTGDQFGDMVECLEPLMLGALLGVALGVMLGTSRLDSFQILSYTVGTLASALGAYYLADQWRAGARALVVRNFPSVAIAMAVGLLLGVLVGILCLASASYAARVMASIW